MRFTLFFFPVLLLLFGCSRPQLIDNRYYMDEYKNSPILVGKIQPGEIWKHIPDWHETYNNIEIDSITVRKISNIDENIRIIVVLGIWCVDSKNGVPAFIKHLDAAANPKISYEIYGVNRQKESVQNIAERYGIERVPTFMILKNEIEFARMIEFPDKTFSEDLITLMLKKENPV